MKRIVAISVACACAAFCVGGVSGCGDASSTEANGNAAFESAEQNQSSIGEEIAGRYRSTYSTDATYEYFVFSADGAAKYACLAYGEESTVCEGTWAENDGNVLVSLPEVKKFKNGRWTSSFDGMTDVSFTFSDGEASYYSADGQLHTRPKITDEEYQEYVLASKEIAPVSSKVGKTFKRDKFYSFVVESISFQDTILPSDTSGYYEYYEAKNGNTFVVARVKFKKKEYCAFGTSDTNAYFKIDGKTYGASVIADDLNGTKYYYGMDSGTFYIYAEVSDKILNAKKIKLIWELPFSVPKYDIDSYKTYEISK